MSNANPSRLGQNQLQGATDELFLKMFSGEVLTAFHNNTVFTPRTASRTIDSGKSASFAIVGKNIAGYHTPGTEILGDKIAHGETVITVDQLLVSSVFIANIDEAMNHYDVRSVYSKECGQALAQQMDRHIAATALKAARSAPLMSGFDGGSTIKKADMRSNSNSLAAALFNASQIFDEKNVPEMDRSCFLAPAQYYLLAQNTTAINSQFGGSGAYADGTIVRVAGVELVKTNNIPKGQFAEGPSKYHVDATDTVALVLQKGAVGTVNLMGLATEAGYDMRRQGTLALAKYACGHGVLRPEMAVELSV